MWKWLILAMFLPVAALAQGLPQPWSDTVSDLDDLIPEEAEARLAQALMEVRAETGVHLVVVAMDRMADHGGAGRSIESYALALFNAWGVGDAARNDGVMILMAIGDREMRIQLGRGYGPEWNSYAQDVIDGDFLPYLRDNRTTEGIEVGTGAVIDRIVRPFAAGQPAPVAAPGPDGEALLPWLIGAPMFLFIVLILGVRALFSDAMVRFKPCPKCGQKTLTRSRAITDHPSEYSSGTGWMTTVCSSCDYVLETPYTIPSLSSSRNSGSGGGSSGGFGGGSSSGGGASGKW